MYVYKLDSTTRDTLAIGQCVLVNDHGTVVAIVAKMHKKCI
jgi:hypothetical protein